MYQSSETIQMYYLLKMYYFLLPLKAPAEYMMDAGVLLLCSSSVRDHEYQYNSETCRSPVEV